MGQYVPAPHPPAHTKGKSKNNINLNIQILRLPKPLMDYVILHELVHTIVKNQSEIFWNTLESFVTNSKILDKQLKKYYLY